MAQIKIEHVAVWVSDLEEMRNFYVSYFDAASNEKYVNPVKHYASYFLSFGSNSARLELMIRPDISMSDEKRGFNMGFAHFAISVGGKNEVDALTERLRNDNYVIFSEPRTTGDGYYESVVLDPEGNYVEITA